jgi:carbonic anhydrase/acetyltransferase-like protein (isoleucine patch superfamily)
MIRDFNQKKPKISNKSLVFEGAIVIGEVEIKDFATIWPGAVIRGDMAGIKVGEMSNVQDNAVLHCNTGIETVIGDRVTVGHGAVLHSCIVQDECLIGMNAVVLDKTVVGKCSIVAAGSVVKSGMNIPPFSLVAGNPATVKKTIGRAAVEGIIKNAKDYYEMAKKYL